MIYKDIGKLMIRTPLFPKEKYNQIFKENNNIKLDDDELIDLCNNPVFREAILISSKSLYNTILKFNEGKEIKKKEYFIQSLCKYIIRMSTRPTPFGLFSGVDFGKYNDKTSICLNTKQTKKFSRPDLEWLMNIVKDLELKYCSKLEFKINSCILMKGNRAVLVHSTEKENELNINEISIRATKAVKKTFELAKTPISFNELKKILIDEFNVQYESKIDDFMKNLIKKEFLISIIRPPLTILDQFSYIINQIKKYDLNKKLLNSLLEIQILIDKYNKTELGKGEDDYLFLHKKMMQIAKAKNILQIDVNLNLKENFINKNLSSDLNEMINILIKLASSNKNSKPFLNKYKQDFIEKYGIDREIPLLELLDNDLGIGPPMDYEKPKNNRINNVDLRDNIESNINKYLIDKYQDALKNGKKQIEIKDSEIKDLNIENLNYETYPDSLEINLILKKDNQGKEIYYLGPNVGSTSIGKTFGRFSHILNNSNEFYKMINKEKQNLKNKEEYTTCEISYLPNETRNANVTRNIHKSQYEISICTTGSKSTPYMINLDEIYIGIENNKFYAKNKKINKKLIITANNMLNTNLAPNALRFLCDISLDNKIMWYDFPWNIAD